MVGFFHFVSLSVRMTLIFFKLNIEGVDAIFCDEEVPHFIYHGWCSTDKYFDISGRKSIESIGKS
jgi:hypothetical protein